MHSVDVSTLLRGSRDTFEALQIAWTCTMDLAMVRAAARRWMARQPPDSVAELRPAREDALTHTSNAFTSQCRLWWRKPACWRDEQNLSDGRTIIRVVRREASLSFDSARMTLYTNSRDHTQGGQRMPERLRGGSGPIAPHTIEDLLPEVPLLQGPAVADTCDVRTIGNVRHVATGRSAVRVRAERRANMNFSVPYYWPFVATYEMVLDREKGVFLKSVAIIDGVQAASFEATAVAFDREISDDVFRFDPPESATIIYI